MQCELVISTIRGERELLFLWSKNNGRRDKKLFVYWGLQRIGRQSCMHNT